MAKRWVALLRAVNLGPTNRVSMADFRAALEAAGATDVTTYVQSGNAVFTAARDVGAALRKALGVEAVVRPATALAKVIAANPFADAAKEPKTLNVAFLDAKPAAAKVTALAEHADRFAPDAFEVKAHLEVIYLRYPKGLARSKMNNAFFEKALGVRATVRNWNTVTKLAELA